MLQCYNTHCASGNFNYQPMYYPHACYSGKLLQS
jgi:hypothetical protein